MAVTATTSTESLWDPARVAGAGELEPPTRAARQRAQPDGVLRLVGDGDAHRLDVLDRQRLGDCERAPRHNDCEGQSPHASPLAGHRHNTVRPVKASGFTGR